MSLLAETTKTATTTPGKWAGRVRSLGCAPPWWASSATVAVCEVDVAGTFTALIMVNRSSKSGKLYAAPYSTKRGDQWVQTLEFTDQDLSRTVSAVAVDAAERFLATTPAQVEPDADEMPF